MSTPWFGQTRARRCRQFCFTVALAFPVTARAQTSDTSFAISRNAVVDITLRSGRLMVRGTERTTAELRAESQQYTLRSTGVGVTITPQDVRSRDYSNRRDSGDRRLELLVPRGVRLIISAGSADVEVEDISGDVEVHTLSGNIGLRGVGGRVIVETLSGDVRLGEGADGARVTTVSGDIVMRGVRGNAEVRTTSGEVSLTVVRATQVQVASTSGDIFFDADLADDARVQLATHSGDVSMRLPESARGVMDVSSFSGEISSNRPVTLTSTNASSDRNRGERGSQRFEFGGGGPARLTVTTFSGDVQFDRGMRRPPE